MKMFFRGLVISPIPIVSYIYQLQSWEGDIITNGILHVILLTVLLLFFSLLYLKNPNTTRSQATTFPLKVFLTSLLIFVLVCLALGIALGLEALAMQLPGVIVFCNSVLN